ncbi:MAG TPA: NAD-dependent epimerase/dehydratase family protein [Thermoanaerobaculia bacterium]|nr:NAD-dependent epimerase/dehydratase family protein [Thermoanaerobaculia bacterium]
MKVLVTGANGFIGRAVVAELLRRGHQVTAAVRTPSGVQATRVVVVGEVDERTDWTDALRGNDVVLHLAAHVHVLDRTAAKDLERFRQVNATGTERLATAAANAGVRRFVFLSTVGVHGTESGARPFRESDPPRPAIAYAQSKWEAEERLQAIGTARGMAYTILRPPLVYGPGVEAKFLQLLAILRRGIPLPFGAVNNRRSMIYIGNLVDATIVAAESDEVRNKTFFVTDQETWSIGELVRVLAELMNKPPRLVSIPESLIRLGARLTRQTERLRPLLGSLVVDDTAFRAATGWKQPYSAKEGLAETVRWYFGRR